METQSTQPRAITSRPGLARRIADAIPHDERLDLPAGLPIGWRIANLVGMLLPLVGFIAAIVYAWGWGVGWTEIGILAAMYLLTGLGVTIGYHRLFTHKSFSTGPVMTAILGVIGSMAVEGSILRWCAYHRAHHRHSDSDHDPHSPHGHGEGVRGMIKGFWTSHMGWMLQDADIELDRYVPDLKRSRLIRTISATFPLWAVLSFIIPAVAGGVITGTWTGALLGFVWGGLIRTMLLHHVTWSVNSICHLWGARPYRSHDHSRNNAIVGILALGEGWHNNHHAFPTSARHGLRWWQFDISWIIIWTMARLGLVWNVRVPTPERQARRAHTAGQTLDKAA